MSVNIPSHYRPWQAEYETLQAYQKALEDNSRIPTTFKEIASWIPRTTISYPEIQPLLTRIQQKVNQLQMKIFPEKPQLLALNLIDRHNPRPINSLVSPLISALNLDPPLCRTSVNRLQKVDSSGYDDLTIPKNFVECEAQNCRLEERIKRINQALNFLTAPLAHFACFGFNNPWMQSCSMTIPSQTRKFSKYAYHHEINLKIVPSPGSFSSIHQCTLKDTSTSDHFIVKCPNEESKKQNLTLRESSLLMLFNHPNIIPCVAINSNGLYFPSGTPLGTHLSNQKTTPHQLKNYILQIATGLNYLHERGFTHNDVKLDNIVIFNNQACLIDFGFTCKTDIKSLQGGAIGYFAPELFIKTTSSTNTISNKRDSWALGVLFLHTIVHGRIFLIKDQSEPSVKEFLKTHLDKPFPLDYFEKINSPHHVNALNSLDPQGHFRKIVAKCLHGNPLHRLSMPELIEELKDVYPSD